MAKYILALFLYLVVWPKNVQAYLDPGTGSYITQVVIGFLAGGMYVGRKHIKNIFDSIKSKFRQKGTDDKEQKD